MTSVGKKLAPKIVSDVARQEATSRNYLMSSNKINERQARDATLAAAVRDLAQMPVTNLVIESCDQDREDNRIIRDELGAAAPFRYTHDRPTNPLLWIPDVHAWAWGPWWQHAREDRAPDHRREALRARETPLQKEGRSRRMWVGAQGWKPLGGAAYRGAYAPETSYTNHFPRLLPRAPTVCRPVWR
ncbi:hypothetical protein [Rhodococcus sp. JS3073]|uniref:hypothetical protein n=1 Tax=Rhodococcus sp. JS3073 TaxID=3002901 RepID=UPI002285EF62|nr:hypothetical protein [Rhodococcus sp. JS3073]WAM19492.1 hypothetical protein OYT95_44365 [Rhodococcus sp. JS3073]